MWLRLGWSLLILLVMVVPLPGQGTHWFEGLDLITHFALFGILGGLNRDLLEASELERVPVLRMLGLVLMVVLPEVLQSSIPTRSFSLLDLAMNGVGTGWGLVVGGSFSHLTYLFVSSTLLGVGFGMNILKEPLHSFLFGEFPSSLVAIGFLASAFLVGVLRYRGQVVQFWTGVFLLVLSGLVATVTTPGSVVFLAAFALMVFLIGHLLEKGGPAESLTILGLGGYLLVLVGTVLGKETFLAHGGLWVVGSILLAPFIKEFTKEWASAGDGSS